MGFHIVIETHIQLEGVTCVPHFTISVGETTRCSMNIIYSMEYIIVGLGLLLKIII